MKPQGCNQQKPVCRTNNPVSSIYKLQGKNKWVGEREKKGKNLRIKTCKSLTSRHIQTLTKDGSNTKHKSSKYKMLRRRVLG